MEIEELKDLLKEHLTFEIERKKHIGYCCSDDYQTLVFTIKLDGEVVAKDEININV